MNEISLSQLLRLALSRLWAIIISAILFAAIAFSYLNFVAKPVYKAHGSLLATNGAITNIDFDTTSSKVIGSDITASLYLSQTITDVLNESGIYKEVSTALEGKYSYKSLMSRATVKRRNDDTLIIDVSFTANNPQDAIEIVNTFLSVAPDYVDEIVPHATIRVTSQSDTASQTFPRTVFSTIIFALVGAVLAFAIVFVIDLFDTAIKTEDDFKSKFDIQILGVIPNFENTGSSNSKGDYYDAVQ